LARFCRRLDPLQDPRRKLLVHRVADAVGLRKLPRVLVSPSAGVPVSIGLLRPSIVLPEAMARDADQREFEAVLLHEMAHIARRDHWVGVGQRIATVLFWWHPLVHRTCDEISALREEICDDHVVLVLGEGRRLAQVLVDLAARVAAGPLLPSTIGVMEPRLAGLTGRVTRLLNKERNMDTRMTLRSKLLVLACGVVVLLGMATTGALRLAQAEPGAEPQPAEAAPAAAETSSPAADVAKKDAAGSDERFEYAGHVVGPDGKPVQGAKLYLIYFTSARLPPPPVRAISGADGSFRFSVAKSEFRGRGEARPPWLLSTVVAVADNLGIGWQSGLFLDANGRVAEGLKTLPGYSREMAMAKKMLPEERRKPIIRLVRDDVPITGRILDDKGQPVAGAAIHLIEVESSLKNDLSDWLKAVEKQKADYYQARMHLPDGLVGNLRRPLFDLFPSAVTDRDGRFRMTGVGRERIARLQLSGPGIATERLYVRTRPGAVIEIDNDAKFPRVGKVTYYGADFEYKARPSRPIVGVVRDKDTKAPLANVVIEGYKVAGNDMHGSSEFINATTDAQGRYRLTGMPIGKDNKLMVVPPLDGPYLLSMKPADTRADRNAVEINFELKRGVIIRGRVTDAATGKPVSAQIDYYVFADNPHRGSAPGFRGVSYGWFGDLYKTDKDGRFTIPGLPGRGIVAVAVHDHQRYPHDTGAEKIKGAYQGMGIPVFKTEPGYCIPSNYHAVAEVNLAEDANVGTVDFALNPLARIEGTMLDDKGQSLSDVMFSGRQEVSSWWPATPGRFEIDGYKHDKPRTLLFIQRSRKLAGSLVLKGTLKGPLSVRLEPWGAVTGRLIGDDGKPLPGVVITDMQRRLPPQEIVNGLPTGEFIRTDQEGRFHIDGLAPGFSYEIDVIPPPPKGIAAPYVQHLASGVIVKSGETKDLGDLKMKPVPAELPAAAKKP
jgi:hypothetical protein